VDHRLQEKSSFTTLIKRKVQNRESPRVKMYNVHAVSN